MAPVTTDVHICNLALTGHLGTTAISAIGENTKAGQLCALHYEATRDALLRAHPWNFAIKRASLAQDSAKTAVLEALGFEFGFAYALPADPYCLKVLRTELEQLGFDDKYRIEGRFLLSNEDSVAVEYIGRVVAVSEYDALFVQALSLTLAIKMCMRMTDNAALRTALKDELRDLQLTAQAVDGQEGTAREIVANDGWLNARV